VSSVNRGESVCSFSYDALDTVVLFGRKYQKWILDDDVHP